MFLACLAFLGDIGVWRFGCIFGGSLESPLVYRIGFDSERCVYEIMLLFGYQWPLIVYLETVY